MIGRVLLAALLAGIAAGLLMGLIQHVRLTPIILQAEVFEQAAGHDHGAAWAPADGLERTAYTFATTIVTGAAFAAMLAGIAMLLGQTISARNGVLWGLAGFLAVSLAPAAGLPPELPGMAAADLGARQIWWAGAIAATGAGIGLLALRREAWALAAGLALIALPHLIGAPAGSQHESAVPAGLASLFTANALAAAALFWCAIGFSLGFTLDRMVKDP